MSQIHQFGLIFETEISPFFPKNNPLERNVVNLGIDDVEKNS